METAKTFTNFLPTEWAETLAYAKKINARLPHFESYLEAREVDAYSENNARVIFEYMRDVAGKPLPEIEKHVICNAQVREEYLQYKKDSDPKNDDGGGMVTSLFRRLRSPQVKATATAPKIEKEQPVLAENFAQNRAKAAEAFLRYVNEQIGRQNRETFQVSFIDIRKGVRHVGQFSIHGDELTMVSGTEWFVFDPTQPSQVTSVGHWPKGATFEDIRKSIAIEKAIDQLSKMEPGAQITANFIEKDSTAEAEGTLTLSKEKKLILTFGENDKRFSYDTKSPFARKQLESPAQINAELKASRERLDRMMENIEARKTKTTNILELLQNKPEGVKDTMGYLYKLSEDGQAVTKSNWSDKVVGTFTKDEFNAMEVERLALKQERGMSMSLGRSR